MLSLSKLVDYCMEKPGVNQDFPFDKKTMVFRILGKIFLLTSVVGWQNNQETINLKNDPEKNKILREQYSAVIPGYHMNKKHWNTINVFEEELSDEQVYQLIDESYEIVKSKLPQNIQKTLS